MPRFAFAGRCSTEDLQDPETSRNWQLTRALALIEPAGGEIVAEYFDAGHSRALPWKRRPRPRPSSQPCVTPTAASTRS
ncbi:hypothetical protein SANT12839_073570 [Streptomyces antimycoticus]|uniref:Resolvase/invertase-type recombinase catalytic domain-containing protein n=1 Tax=Streptomyces antimycoticus TaxID=68175 RepID=A0A4D4KBX6_9ACTN|nr:hypothetical protein [Streptomyces antimycoticus]GDY46475.1 hypothetical protein SANT12839_073570 [Streptomyces antimycoticus]